MLFSYFYRYSVYSLNSPNFHHKVGIGIYTEDVKKTGQRLWKPIVPNLAKFSLGTQNKRFQHEKVRYGPLQCEEC